MWLPTIVGVVMGSGRLGTDMQALAVPVTGVAALAMPGLIAAVMSRQSVLRQYFARIPASVASLQELHACGRCGEAFHRSDFVLCPFHNGAYICSGCCAAEHHCNLVCHAPSRQQA